MHCVEPGFFHVQRRNKNGARADGDRRNVRCFVGPKHHWYADGGVGRRGKFSHQWYSARSGKPWHPQRSERRAQCRKSGSAAAALDQRSDDHAISLISRGRTARSDCPRQQCTGTAPSAAGSGPACIYAILPSCPLMWSANRGFPAVRYHHMLKIYNCIATAHDLRLVGLAALVCVLASLAAINLLRHARKSAGHMRGVWLAVSAISTGFGIWATHFIAMLAFTPGIPSGYNIMLTILSLVAAILLTGAGLAVSLVPNWRPGSWIGGVIVGGGIAAMHYTGMAAFEIAGIIRFLLPHRLYSARQSARSRFRLAFMVPRKNGRSAAPCC